MEKPAVINSVPTGFEMDIFFLWPYAMLTSMPPIAFWITLIGLITFFSLLPMPFLVQAGAQDKIEPVHPAEVNEKCTGCSLCDKDCPYEAIEMVPAPAGSRFKLRAVVLSHRCSTCGLCVGACAFDAIDIPELPDNVVIEKMKNLLAQSSSSTPSS